MKTLLVSIRFDTPDGNYVYTGLVEATIRNNKAIISLDKLFLNAFGKQLPSNTIIHC